MKEIKTLNTKQGKLSATNCQYNILTGSGSTVVKHLSHHVKGEGLSPAPTPGTGWGK